MNLSERNLTQAASRILTRNLGWGDEQSTLMDFCGQYSFHEGLKIVTSRQVADFGITRHGVAKFTISGSCKNYGGLIVRNDEDGGGGGAQVNKFAAYRPYISLYQGIMIGAICNCPFKQFESGRCKHVAALAISMYLVKSWTKSPPWFPNGGEKNNTDQQQLLFQWSTQFVTSLLLKTTISKTSENSEEEIVPDILPCEYIESPKQSSSFSAPPPAISEPFLPPVLKVTDVHDIDTIIRREKETMMKKKNKRNRNGKRNHSQIFHQSCYDVNGNPILADTNNDVTNEMEIFCNETDDVAHPSIVSNSSSDVKKSLRQADADIMSITSAIISHEPSNQTIDFESAAGTLPLKSKEKYKKKDELSSADGKVAKKRASKSSYSHKHRYCIVMAMFESSSVESIINSLQKDFTPGSCSEILNGLNKGALLRRIAKLMSEEEVIVLDCEYIQPNEQLSARVDEIDASMKTVSSKIRSPIIQQDIGYSTLNQQVDNSSPEENANEQNEKELLA